MTTRTFNVRVACDEFRVQIVDPALEALAGQRRDLGLRRDLPS